jgi:hypothetical protein
VKSNHESCHICLLDPVPPLPNPFVLSSAAAQHNRPPPSSNHDLGTEWCSSIAPGLLSVCVRYPRTPYELHVDLITAEHAIVVGLDGDYMILDALSILKISTLHSQCSTLNGKSDLQPFSKYKLQDQTQMCSIYTC